MPTTDCQVPGRDAAPADADRLGGRFARLWAASTLSALGSSLATIAAPLLVASRTSDPLVVSAAVGVSWLPWLLLSLPGGVLVDRVDRRRLMVVVDWVRVVAVGILALAIATERDNMALLCAVLFVVSAGETVFHAASEVMVQAIVAPPQLERANGWLVGGFTLMQGMVARPLGGILFALAASAPFFVNAGTYALSAILLGSIAGAYRSSPSAADAGGGRRARSVRAEILEGFRWLAGQRLLRSMVVLMALLNMSLTASMAVLVLLARERLGLGAVGYGFLLTSMAVGGVVGSSVGDRLIRRLTATWTIRIGLLIEAGMHAVLATSRSPSLVFLTLFVFGAHCALWSIVRSSLGQRLTPPEMLGRIGSVSMFIAAGGNCIGALIGGVLAASFGLTAPYWVGLVVAAAVAAATWHVFDRDSIDAAYRQPVAGPASETPAIVL